MTRRELPGIPSRVAAIDEELDDASVEVIARELSRWFATNARDLPWRRTRDPYAIWVSEIMLQQTRVETVENYWSSFLARFPTVHALASADQDAVLQQWSGLGYYRRARLLHRGAKHVHEELGGALPSAAEQLRTIPGIGPYTAGAIASIAFDQRAPLVDGNVARVHSRLAQIEQPREQDAKAAQHWRFVERVLEHGRPRVLAQALMELGATVCTPGNPRCSECPVRRVCRAHASGTQGLIPAVRVKKKSPELHFHALALGHGQRLLLERRPAEGLLAGLWCLPLFERQLQGEPGDLDAQRDALAAAASEQLGVAITLDARPAAAVKHVFTHRVWHLLPWSGRARRAVRTRQRADARNFMWLGESSQPDGGVPSLTRKLLAAVGHGQAGDPTP
ncbi:A/G-specific adenine glycosylase [Enhygromyxa salina]|uniref:Adenine DNA glycosylase n=1 Tax=Enhygromyxa salina TaxID=215803 RepID=A0A0C2D6T1_9BACT|nr:A/G-specific adenine glycosylase [Enhygromyxa salina]KIG15712.1 A/G-specific adenine glycosylase [Enhygromyxa salina]